MRKYRVWHKKDKRYYEVYMIHFLAKLIRVKKDNEIWQFPFDEVVIEQFTGRRDKFDKEAYEGDVVLRSYGQGEGVIIWSDNEAAFVIAYMEDDYIHTQSLREEFEIIDNVHDRNEKMNYYSENY